MLTLSILIEACLRIYRKKVCFRAIACQLYAKWSRQLSQTGNAGGTRPDRPGPCAAKSPTHSSFIVSDLDGADIEAIVLSYSNLKYRISVARKYFE